MLGEWVKTLPEPFDKEMAELYQEMEAAADSGIQNLQSFGQTGSADPAQ